MQIRDFKLIKQKDERDWFRWYFRIDAPDHNALRVDLYYSKGGYSGLDWTYKERGYYTSITPVQFTDKGSYSSETSTLYGKNSGGYVFLEPTARFNAKYIKTLETKAEKALQPYLDSLLKGIKAGQETAKV